MLSGNKLSRGLLACFFSVGISSAWAASDNTGWFVGGAMGAAQADFSERGVDSDDETFLSGVYGGYNINPRFGFDSQLFLGKYDDFRLGVYSLTSRVNFLVASNFSLFARGGLASMVVVDEDDDDEAFGGIVPTIGIGARFDITNKIKMNLAVDYLTGELEYFEDSVLDGTEVDVDQASTSVSVYYQF